MKVKNEKEITMHQISEVHKDTAYQYVLSWVYV